MNYLKYLVAFILIIDTIALNLTNQTNSTIPLRQSTTPISSSATRLNSYFDFFISMKNQPK